MLFNEFERLVNYAVGGSMVDAEVTDVVKQLKNEKTNIMRNIALLPAGEERRTSFKRLHVYCKSKIQKVAAPFCR